MGKENQSEKQYSWTLPTVKLRVRKNWLHVKINWFYRSAQMRSSWTHQRSTINRSETFARSFEAEGTTCDSTDFRAEISQDFNSADNHDDRI